MTGVGFWAGRELAVVFVIPSIVYRCIRCSRSGEVIAAFAPLIYFYRFTLFFTLALLTRFPRIGAFEDKLFSVIASYVVAFCAYVQERHEGHINALPGRPVLLCLSILHTASSIIKLEHCVHSNVTIHEDKIDVRLETLDYHWKLNIDGHTNRGLNFGKYYFFFF